MKRLVVRVAAVPNEDPSQQALFLSLEDPPYEGFKTLHPFTSAPSVIEQYYEDPPSGNNIRDVGETLLLRLSENPAVAGAVRSALQDTPQNGCCPVLLDMEGAEAAAEYPWETLFDPGSGFLALEGRWPVARIATQAPLEKDIRTFTPPLRLMAVMSAVGVSAADEWTALRSAITGAGIGMDMELKLWVGEKALAATIRDELAADGLRGSVALLSRAPALLRDIKRFAPHLLHLFCHGEGGASPLLKLATRRDHELGHGSSVVLEPLQLREVGRFPWIVTINACEGGSDSEGARSLAYLLIRAGYPAVVGMRDPVSSVNAAVFCQAFYGSLLESLDEDLMTGEEVEVQLAAALVLPRRELRDRYAHATPTEAAALHRDWTLPVLYTRREPLRVRGLRADPRHDAATRKVTTDYLDMLLQFLREAPPGTPQQTREQIQREVVRAIGELSGASA